ncbi:PulJ/GspJ family protein [Alteromonas sp. A079]|uniref:PulJ/GspJ family protein n=1 Tax=Alteromonas sp. A079 TaxID=3410268 RepID=UPI003BA17CD7
MKRAKGFTLVELILVITILGIISVSVAQVIALSVQIYATGAERARLVSEARFIVLRLEKELRNIIPNSVVFDATSECLTFYPIKQSGTYVDDALDNPMHSVLFDGTPQVGDTLVVFPTSPQSVVDNGQLIDNVVAAADAPLSAYQFDITLAAANTQTSPGKRFYIPEPPVSICKTVTTQGARLVRSQGALSSVLGVNVTQWDAQILTTGLRQNGLVALSLTFEGNDNEQLAVVHEVHFPNVP